ncbi:MAG: class I SAM-dependent methyltransferase [Pseudomonadota bacterium]
MTTATPDLMVMTSAPRPDYALVDSGDGRKYERYGDYHFIRPEPQAMWSPRLDSWPADAEFIPASDEDGGGRWHYDSDGARHGWELTWNDEVRFHASCTPFRHLGFFPDMDPVWRWMREQIAGVETSHVMNLFGYTGVGTLALSAAGAHLVHVDASKKSVAQARDNAALSDMTERPIRWLVEDAAKFTAREVRRGRHYDGILLDPPKFGRGPNGETWRIETDLPGLIADCRQLVDADSRFVFLTVYAVRMSPLALEALMRQHFGDLPGTIEAGELAVAEEGGRLILPTALFARWSAAQDKGKQ